MRAVISCPSDDLIGFSNLESSVFVHQAEAGPGAVGVEEVFSPNQGVYQPRSTVPNSLLQRL